MEDVKEEEARAPKENPWDHANFAQGHQTLDSLAEMTHQANTFSKNTSDGLLDCWAGDASFGHPG